MPAMAAGDDITVHVEWLVARRLMQQQEDDAAAMEPHRIMVNTHRVSRVPDLLRSHNPDAYTPGLVAIGPLHARDAESRRRLRPGNRLKMAYLNSLISRGNPDGSRHLGVMQRYVHLVAAREREARAMYAAEDVADIAAEDFIQMLVLDGCFIIEHLVNVAMGNEEPELHATPFGPTQLSVDLILAENQIPFFVLVDLIGCTRLLEFDPLGLVYDALLMKLVLYYLGGEKGRDISEELPPADAVFHILHLLHAMVTAAHTLWESPTRLQDAGPLVVEKLQAAARLLRRGLLLLPVLLLYPTLPVESRWSATYRLEDLPSANHLKRMLRIITMSSRGGLPAAAGGIVSVLGSVPLRTKLSRNADLLCLPQLRIESRTAALLLNLMAFEQSAGHHAGDVSAYVWFMSKLVQSSVDAAVLVAADVVRSGTSVSAGKIMEVARFFRQVGAASEADFAAASELEKSFMYMAEMLTKLRERSQHNTLSTKMADVKRYYVDVPWRLVVAFVTVVITVATVLQTFAAFKQKP